MQRSIATRTTSDRRPAAAAVAARASATSAHAAQTLQRRLGSEGVATLLAHGTQRATSASTAHGATLRVSSPTDASEREAAAVARQVVRGATTAAVAPAIAPRSAIAPATASRTAMSSLGTNAVRAPVVPVARIQQAATGGAPLSRDVRDFMESRLGADLSHVLVHTDERAAALCDNLGANALTTGSHIFFGRNQYRPHSPEGRELLAHELVHTMQQARGGAHAIQRDDKKGNWWTETLDFGESVAWHLVETAAPALAPILHKGPAGVLEYIDDQASHAINNVVDRALAPVHALTGLADELTESLAPIAADMQIAVARIARNDCTPLREAADKIEKTALRVITPIVERLQPLVAAAEGFLSDVWDTFGKPIWDWIQQFAADEWAAIKWLGEQVWAYYTWVWNKTAWARSLAASAWDWIKDKLGIGDGAEGHDGLLQWASRKLELAWATIKTTLEPFRRQLTVLGAGVAGLALALSPAGPVLAIGAAIYGAVDGLRWIQANWGKGNLVVAARVYLEKTLIPPLLVGVHRFGGAMTSMAASLSATLAGIAGALDRATGALGSTVLRFAAVAVRWVANQAIALAAWARQQLETLAAGTRAAVANLQHFLHGMLDFFADLGKVVLDVWSLPVMLAGKAWNWVPACIRDPVVDFVVPLVVGQIELFQELVKDNKAWQRTKADIQNLIRLVFKDHDLAGAVKAAFFLVLRVFDLPPDLLVKVARKAEDAWDTVSRKPLEFIKNTVRALGRGFGLLWANIEGHLEFGLKGWLLGQLDDAKITLPQDWKKPKEVFFFVMDVLGLNLDHVFVLLKQRFNDEQIGKIRTWTGRISRAADWIDKAIDINKSPAENSKGLIDQAKDFGTTILKGVVQWVTVRVAEELALLAASAAASAGLSEVLDIARRIYKALVTAKRWARRILDMVSDALDNVLEIASGAIEPVAKKFEDIMHRGMPVVIGFLADQVGLGDVGQQIAALAGKLHKNVDDGVLWVIDKVKVALAAVIGAAQAGVAALVDWWNDERKFTGLDGKTHRVFFKGGKDAARMMVASKEAELEFYLINLAAGKKESGENVSNDTRGAANAALAYYREKIRKPVESQATHNRGKATAPIIDFAARMSEMSTLLEKLVGDAARPAPPTKWDPQAPAHSKVDFLSVATGRKGTDASGACAGWNDILAGGLTQSKGNWVRMHMITAGVGGFGDEKNTIPAPHVVNTGSIVRGFELRVESLVKRDQDDKKKASGPAKPSVIWIDVLCADFHTRDFGNAKDLLSNAFAGKITFTAGFCFFDHDLKWKHSPTIEVSAETRIPAPDFSGGLPDLNTASATSIASLTGVKLWFAEDMCNLRGRDFTTRFARVDEWSAAMTAVRDRSGVAKTDEFKDYIKFVAAAVNGEHPKARFVK